MKPLVSIIIPVFNRQNFILECLESVVEQTYRPLEVILVDDGSTDDSIVLINNFIEKNAVKDVLEIKLIQQLNSGAPHARNKGLSEANGEYVQFLDSDDLLLPKKLNNQISVFNENVNIVYSKTQMFQDTKKNLLDKYWGRELTGGYKDYFEFPWQTMCALYKRNYLIESDILWNENLKIHQDWEFSMRHVITMNNIVFLDEVNSLYRTHNEDRIGLNLSVDKIKSIENALFGIYRELENKRLLSPELKFLYFKRLSFCFYSYGSDALKKEKKEVWAKMYYIRRDLSLILYPFLFLGPSFFKLFGVVYKKQ
ncbi:MAG: glycosyltransferase involved in cell wall biosynthesis [bacterium]|jgi:glycosyltransferase involved in cell wall biosynthesis